jgi:hypothetical protein
MMRFLTLVLAVLPIAAPATDLSGKWMINGDVVGNAVSLDCTFQQNGEGKLAGKCAVNGMDPSDIAGDVKEAEFKFSFTTGGYTLTYSGTVQGESVKGSIEVAGVNGTFSGTRVKQ